MKHMIPDARLQLVASLVPQGARMADVGSDHAYLPVYLMQKGKIASALATDVNEGPIRRAESNIAKAGYAGKIGTRKCDGLDGIEDFAPDTVTVCGMGGELIASILSQSRYVLSAKPLLILQPMTQVAFLRNYLTKNGYEILSEHLCPEAHRLYQILVCRYEALPQRELSAFAALAGEKTKEDAAYPLLLSKLKQQYEQILAGKKQVGLDTSLEESILSEIDRNETH